MDPERLLSLATSDSWSDRALAGRELGGMVGRDDVDDAVRLLLLDPRDTGVTDATAEALLQRGDLAALRLFASAWKVADPEHADHLAGAWSGMLFRLSCGSPADRARFRTVLRELLADRDGLVRDGAQDLVLRLAQALRD